MVRIKIVHLQNLHTVLFVVYRIKEVMNLILRSAVVAIALSLLSAGLAPCHGHSSTVKVGQYRILSLEDGLVRIPRLSVSEILDYEWSNSNVEPLPCSI